MYHIFFGLIKYFHFPMRRDFVLSKFFIRSAKSHDTFLGIIWRMVQRRIHCICSIVSKIWLPVTRRILAIRRCLKSHAWKKRQLRKLGNMKKKNQTYCIPRWTKRELKGFFFGNLKKEKYTQDHVYLFFYANHLRQARWLIH